MVHSDFVHLHVHTQYSLLDGACHLKKLVERAKKLKMPALAITDHGNLFGTIQFYNYCLKYGVKPIIGCETYIAPDSRFNKDYKQIQDSNYHLVLLVKNKTGYRNLLKLTSLGHLEGFYYKPRIDKKILKQYNEGLIGLSACLKGEVAANILKGNLSAAYKKADEYLNIFGEGNFYLELMDNGLPEQKKVNQGLVKISKELGIPLVATNDVHYLDKDQAFAHEVLLGIQTQRTINDPQRFRFGSDTFYLRTAEEMKETFKEYPQAVKNTLDIMQKCNITFDFSKTHLPKFSLPDGVSADQYLSDLCYESITKRYQGSTPQIKERIEYELDIIKKTGFSSYFLIVWDLVRHAKQNNIPVGPGRGSAAGSIVSYLLGITDVDPLRYDLIFERFLNPQRISMPDIDLDFCYEKREKIIEYVGHKYGKDNVAQIITFGTMLARAVIRDVGRVLEFSYSEVDKIAKMIPLSVGNEIDLKKALKISPELKATYKTNDNIKRLIDTAMKLEGLSRHASTHAAGVVISDKPLTERIPLVKGSEEETVTGFDMDSLEKVGMLKMDFLGLKTLTVINNTRQIIKRTKNKEIDIDTIPIDDKKTFSLLKKASTVGVFQLESRGMRGILQKINPTRFEDLIAVLALYRPGPLGSGMVDDFIERKHGKKSISYVHPKLEPILKETYGIILYQEQTMRIASDLAGFTLAQADLLRKAIGKKIPEIMQEQKQLFIQGCKKNDIPEKIASKIFDLIDYFSGYGFNKSHSTAYALISYRTAYLKANYPVEFMAALLTSERNNTDKVVGYINEAKHMGIKVLPPDINESYANFTVTDDGNIRFGLMAIKNVGKTALESIIQIRSEKKFKDFFDFCHRVDSRTVNKKVVESLIKSGAMDSFNLKRAQMIVILDKVLERNHRRQKVDPNQMCLFKPKPVRVEVPEVEEWPTDQILDFEKKLLGMYVTSHPMNKYENTLKKLKIKDIASLYEGPKRDKKVTAIGVVENVKLTTTRRKNERMAIIKIEDKSASVESFVFPRVYAKYLTYLVKGKIIAVTGRVQAKEQIPNIIAEEITPIEDIFSQVKELNIIVKKNSFKPKVLKDIFSKHQGGTPVYFILRKSRFRGVKIRTADNYHLALSESLLDNIGDIVGQDNIRIRL